MVLSKTGNSKLQTIFSPQKQEIGDDEFKLTFIFKFWTCKFKFVSTPDVVFYRERDNFEAELKELKRRYEAVDLSHAAVTRERDTLSKEVHHTDFFLVIPSKSFFHGSVLIYIYIF